MKTESYWCTMLLFFCPLIFKEKKVPTQNRKYNHDGVAAVTTETYECILYIFLGNNWQPSDDISWLVLIMNSILNETKTIGRPTVAEKYF